MPIDKKELKIQLLQFLISNINKDSRRNNQYVFYIIQPNLMNTTLGRISNVDII